MMNKHVLIFVFVVLLLAGSSVGWFLFQQSARLKSLNQDEGSRYSGQIQEQVASPEAEEGSANTSVQVLEDISLAEPDGSTRQISEDDSESWVENTIFTPSLVQDAAGFLVEHYHPPGSPGASEDKGMITMSFKVLNARYGIHFLSLHAADKGIEQARSRVLQYALQPYILERIYALYVQQVLEALSNEAEQARKTFYAPDGEKHQAGLTAGQTAEMFALYAEYFQAVGKLMGILSDDRDILVDVQEYLQAEQEAVHAGYILKKAAHSLAREQNEAEKISADTQEEKDKKDMAAEKYRQALRRREQSKQRILDRIQSRAPELNLATHEIMYIAQWMHRRLIEGEKTDALNAASDLLTDFAGRLQDRAVKIRAGKTEANAQKEEEQSPGALVFE